MAVEDLEWKNGLHNVESWHLIEELKLRGWEESVRVRGKKKRVVVIAPAGMSLQEVRSKK